MTILSKNNLDKYQDIAVKTSNEAAEYLLKRFGSHKKVHHKSDRHWGIEEDIELNKFYEDKLRQLTPEASIYSEEGERNLDSELVWVIDPIDGTSNYRVAIPFYTTQICLLVDREPVVSVIRAPTLKQNFTAVKGRGSFLNARKIKVSNIKKINEAMISIGKGTKYDDLLWYGGIMRNIMGNVRTFRHFGSCGLELSYTAVGMIDIYINKGSHHIYDFAPGSLILREAGAILTDFNGNNWNINEDTIVASNKYLSKDILNVLKNPVPGTG